MALDDHDRLQSLLFDALADPESVLGNGPLLLETLEHEDPAARISAAWALCLLAEDRPEVADDLFDRLSERPGTAARVASTWIAARHDVDGGESETAPIEGTTDRDVPVTESRRSRAVPGPDSSDEGAEDDSDEVTEDDDEDWRIGAWSDEREPRAGPTRLREDVTVAHGEPDRTTGDGSVVGGGSTGAVGSADGRADASQDRRSTGTGTDQHPQSRSDTAVDGDRSDASSDSGGGDDEPGDGEPTDPEFGTRGGSPAGEDRVIGDGEFRFEVELTGVDSVEYLDRVASGQHVRTYAGMGTIDGQQRAILVRTYVPPEGVPVERFAGAFEDAIEGWASVDDHENVLSVHDWGRRPHPWAILDYGTRTLRAAGRLPPGRAFRVGLDVARGLARCHEGGVVHGGLDPGSIVLDTRTDPPSPRVLGVGIAAAFDSVGGTVPIDPRYAAPEHLGDEYGSIDWMTDVYQLGTVLYTLFTGRPPIEEDAVDPETIEAAEPLSPASVVDGLPPAADRIVSKATATYKIARYESVDELARDLQSTLADYGGSR